jgi:hypothetical protein
MFKPTVNRLLDSKGIYDPALALYLPFWKRDGAVFQSDDQHGHVCTQYGTPTFLRESLSGDVAANQGIATDGTYFYLISTTSIRKTDSAWATVATNNNAATEAGINHVADGNTYGGKLYLACSDFSGVGTNGRIGVWNTSDLSFVATHDIHLTCPDVSGLYVDGPNDIIYTVGFNTVGTYIFMYRLSDFSYLGTITLSTPIPYAQGITKHGDYLFISQNGDSPAAGSVQVVSLSGVVRDTVVTDVFEVEGIDYSTSKLYVLRASSPNGYVSTYLDTGTALWAPLGRRFNRKDTYIDCGNALALQITDTITAIVNIITLPSFPVGATIKDISAGEMIIGKYYTTGNQRSWEMVIMNPENGGLADNIFIFASASGGGGEYESYAAFNLLPNTAYSIAMTHKSGETLLYINGEAKTLTIITGSERTALYNSSASLKLGMLTGGSQYFGGIIGGALIYNRVLTPQEISNLYMATKWRYQ